MLVAAVSPALRKLARRTGYVAAIPAGIAPRILYRRLPPMMAVTPFAHERAAASGEPTLQ